MTTRRNWLLTLFGALATSMAVAGAWGTGLLENDDALDFLDMFVENPDARYADLVPNSLGEVAYNDGYLYSSDATFALVAAEIVAAMNGNPSDDLPPEVLAWAKNQDKPDDLTFIRARKILDRVLNEETSELAQLWAEDGTLYAAFKSAIADLRSRLD
ncbi:MAG: DUF4259 domain-containing protein [Pseudomonadota bacterium]